MKILVTGFEPFGGESINPAGEVVKSLPDSILGSQIIPLIVPTVFYESLDVIKDKILEVNPDVILSIGQAGGRNAITVERVAININDARIADNAGNQMIDEPIESDGPTAYFSTLPIKAMVEKMKESGINASISNTAGTFVCNHVMYGILHACANEFKGKRAGFIHIPYLPEQVINKENMPSMELTLLIKGILCSIEAIIQNEEDLKLVGGLEH